MLVFIFCNFVPALSFLHSLKLFCNLSCPYLFVVKNLWHFFLLSMIFISISLYHQYGYVAMLVKLRSNLSCFVHLPLLIKFQYHFQYFPYLPIIVLLFSRLILQLRSLSNIISLDVPMFTVWSFSCSKIPALVLIKESSLIPYIRVYYTSIGICIDPYLYREMYFYKALVYSFPSCDVSFQIFSN